MVDIVKELEDLDKLFVELNEVESKPHTGEPQPDSAAPPPPFGETSISPTSVDAETQPENSAVSPGISILPQTGQILENVKGALDLIISGMQAEIVRLGLQENSEQLGPLSVVLANIKKAKNQVDVFLGHS